MLSHCHCGGADAGRHLCISIFHWDFQEAHAHKLYTATDRGTMLNKHSFALLRSARQNADEPIPSAIDTLLPNYKRMS